MKVITFPLSIFALVVFLSACPFWVDDTCTQGENMTQVQMLEAPDSQAANPVLRFTWQSGTQKGAQLPESYFQQVTVYYNNPREIRDLIADVYYSASSEITIEFNDLSTFMADRSEFELTLMFPDRRRSINCEHAGSDDDYLLHIRLFVDETGILSTAEFNQEIIYGAI